MEEPGAYLTAMQQLNGEVKVEVTYACTRDSEIAIADCGGALLNTWRYTYNTLEHRNNAFLPYIWRKDKRPAFEIDYTTRPQVPPGEFGNTRLRTSAIYNYCYYVNYNGLRKQLAHVCILQVSDRLIEIII